MDTAKLMDSQVAAFGFWCALAALASAVVSFFLPLDVPGGYEATHPERLAWLNEHRGTFIVAWLNQIIAMLSLSGALAAAVWSVREKSPLSALLAALAVLGATVAFIVPKFMAIWTIPALAASAGGADAAAALAATLLPLLNVTIPFSLYTSFDFLGFWLYAVFAVLAAAPVYGDSRASKVLAVGLGAFGLVYHGMLVALLAGAIAPAAINDYFLGATGLLVLALFAMPFYFRNPGVNRAVTGETI